MLQEVFERALIFIAILLPLGETDVVIDAEEEQAEQHGIRYHEEDADEHQLLRYFQAMEKSRHGLPL